MGEQNAPNEICLLTRWEYRTERTGLLKYLKILLDLNNILLDHQNNYTERVDDNVAESFNILTSLSVLHKYFNDSNKITYF